MASCRAALSPICAPVAVFVAAASVSEAPAFIAEWAAATVFKPLETAGAGIYPAVLDLVQTVQNNLPQINAAAMGLATVLGFGITLLTNLVGSSS